MRALALGILALSWIVGCAEAPAKESDAEKPELSPEAKALVLDEVPSNVAHPLYVDFNGKAELIGYSLEPASMAAPGSKLTLKLYWRSTGKLGEGYLPYTELVTPTGRRIEVDGSGPVRKGPLTPSNWELGKVYIDELEVAVPADIDAARFSIVVGIKTQPIAPEAVAEADEKAGADAKKPKKEAEKPSEGTFSAVYLSVLSGPADSKHGAQIASLETGATPGAQRARAKDDKRNPGALKRLPVSAKPRPAAPAQ